MPPYRHCLFVALLLIRPGVLYADVRLPAIISDHMVLLRSSSVPIWGWADPDENVAVAIDGRTAQTKATHDGKWSVALNLADAGAGPFELTVEGKNKVAVTDVAIGAVWLASGQSNMEFLLKLTAGASVEIARSQNSLLRQFRVEKKVCPLPADDCRGTWTLAGPETAGEFTAVGYYFGKRLQQSLNVPVGIVNASWGGTFSEAWTSRDAIARIESLKNADEQGARSRPSIPAKRMRSCVSSLPGCRRTIARTSRHRRQSCLPGPK